jgi:hypothetical protein
VGPNPFLAGTVFYTFLCLFHLHIVEEIEIFIKMYLICLELESFSLIKQGNGREWTSRNGDLVVMDLSLLLQLKCLCMLTLVP